MPLPVLPQELLDAIIGEVDDVAALKACSLVGSPVRYTSWHPSALADANAPGEPTNYGAASTLLAESPHIAGYIIRLTIEIPEVREDIESIQQVIGKLANVCRCIVKGVDKLNLNELPPAFTSTLLDFIHRQPLWQLHLRFIKELSVAVFLQLVVAAPVLSFDYVFLQSGEDLSSPTPTHPFAIDNLILTRHCEDICIIMARPECTVGISSLRRLSIPPHYAPAETLICSASRTLRILRLYLLVPLGPLTISLPSLPALRTLEFALSFRDRANAWVLNTLTGLLPSTSSSALAEVTLTFFSIWASHYRPAPPRRGAHGPP
ncbi:hypothetical protein FB451DRAFT_1562323 [Mycena latifolia]|nr:hypothetical protein FB451DRAFT_1562323 [Mycena latifolia]